MKKRDLSKDLQSSQDGVRKRSVAVKRILAAGAVIAVVAGAGTTLAGVSATKHNFGSFGKGSIVSPDTTEVCVFCHTPHNSNPSGPMWNRADSGANYNVYESQSLAATLTPNAPVLGQPTGSSKLCLSCHDGTIAIGSLLNLPGRDGIGGGTLAVTGPGIDPFGRLTSASTAYIGTDLRDDHPISFDYSSSYPSNPEIKSDTTLPKEVKLDTAGRVQCTSCHDPHGTQFTKFLVTNLDGGNLCSTCHDKRYWATMPSIHKTSTAKWNGTGTNPWHEDLGTSGFSDDDMAKQSCLACHRSHNGAGGKQLLKGTDPVTGNTIAEEWTCLNCHNGNVAAKNVEPQFNYPYKHDVKGKTGLHQPSRTTGSDPARESAANLGANRHAECSDCHNSHAVKPGNHTMGGANGNIIGSNILGSWGVKPAPWGAAGSSAVTYQVVDFTTTAPGNNNLEGYLCMKCHSYYAYGVNTPEVPSGNADGSLAKQQDISASFNPLNFSYHPVFAQGKNIPPATANPAWPANGLGLTNTFRYAEYPGVGVGPGFYSITHTSTITCTDCHSSSNVSDPRGAHGSMNRWLLRNNETGVGSPKNFCYNCHRRDVYGDEGYVGPLANYSRVPHPVDGMGAASPFYTAGTNTGNNGNKFGNLCMTCHGGMSVSDGAFNHIDGIHGSNMGKLGPPLGSTVELGTRMMNGACVSSHRPATSPGGKVQMFFRSVNPTTDPICNNSFSNINGNSATYNY